MQYPEKPTFLSESQVIDFSVNLLLDSALARSLSGCHVTSVGAMALAKALGDPQPHYHALQQLQQEKIALQHDKAQCEHQLRQHKAKQAHHKLNKEDSIPAEYHAIFTKIKDEINHCENELHRLNNSLQHNAEKTIEAKRFKSNTQLKFLDLSHNKITDEGAIALSRALAVNKNLTIDLSGNYLISAQTCLWLQQEHGAQVITSNMPHENEIVANELYNSPPASPHDQFHVAQSTSWEGLKNKEDSYVTIKEEDDEDNVDIPAMVQLQSHLGFLSALQQQLTNAFNWGYSAVSKTLTAYYQQAPAENENTTDAKHSMRQQRIN